MKISEFDYPLPAELIAQFPLFPRPSSRLLHIKKPQQKLLDRQFEQLPEILQPGDLLVLNNTKVIPARLMGEKETGGKIEIFIDCLLGQNRARALIRASKSPKPGTRLHVADCDVRVTDRQDELYFLQFELDQGNLEAFLQQHGDIPLPPYIQRETHESDHERYQTVFAQNQGAVAAPTAGLHFDENLLNQLQKADIQLAYITLHVGLGTFQPVRVDDIRQHKMHKEQFHINEKNATLLEQARQDQRRMVAVGTTSLRCLESVDHFQQAVQGETDLFIYPGYTFKHCQALITNFHLPRSTLLMLVSAFGGPALIKRAYAHAIEQRYRFFSYGDAMFIEA